MMLISLSLPEQIEAEVDGIIDMIDRFYRVFGFEYKVELSTRPERRWFYRGLERATMI